MKFMSKQVYRFTKNHVISNLVIGVLGVVGMDTMVGRIEL